jgi:ubiquinol-cytochrome c reductase cytochrome b subunit
LNRFFALHVVALPIVILGLVVLHILALHEVGSNNPDGVDIKKKRTKTASRWTAFLPPVLHRQRHRRRGGVPVRVLRRRVLLPGNGRLLPGKPNFEQANAFKTPEHIAPVWYFTPFYAILRAVPDKLMG